MNLDDIRSETEDFYIPPLRVLRSTPDLTPAEHGEIVWLLKSSCSHEAIAKKFNVYIETVQKIFGEYNTEKG